MADPAHYSAGSLDALSVDIHDAYFDLSTVQYDAAAQTLAVPYRTRRHKGETRLVRRGWLTKEFETDWLRRVLTVRYVTAFEVLRDQGIETYSFDGCRQAGDAVEFVTCEGLVLRCRVAGVEIEDREMGHVGKARYKVGPFGIESDSGQVRE